jgi:CheY-like chemotaxis protein
MMTRHWLVVDDEVADTFILRRAIKDSGHKVQILFFQTGQDLIRHIEAGNGTPFELILLDINMPQIDGFELLGRLKDLIKEPHVPLVMYSNTKNEKDSQQAFDMGASGFISKPTTFFEAKAIVNVLDILARQY